MSTRQPGFFIVGAPKCGTTSLAAWLHAHPRIFMSKVKEPSYFDTDSPHVGLRRLDHYLRCFQGAGPEHVAVGEASPNYLFSAVAVTSILKFNPAAKLIVALRNPVEMAWSLHSQLLFNYHEDVEDFATAWALQERRQRGLDIPKYSKLPHFLQYRAACSLGTQLARLYHVADRDRVCAVLLDDLNSEPRGEYLRILSFLGVPDDGRTSFPVMNAQAGRSSGSMQLLRRNLSYLKQRLGIAHLSRTRWARDVAVVPAPQPLQSRPDATIRTKLEDAFRREVDLLQRLLTRDLQKLWRYAAVASSPEGEVNGGRSHG
jgi:hypothetical protein